VRKGATPTFADLRGTIMVQHTLRPLIVVMAGPDVVDPFKD